MANYQIIVVIAKVFHRMKKEWKSFCYKADDALITSFKSLLQTSNVSLLKTPEQIKEMFQEMLFEDCNELVPTSNSEKKKLCELNTLSQS